MKKMFKLNPFFSEKVWGYEKWNLSTHRNGCSTIDASGENLHDYLNEDLPILIKIIKAEDSLSVQVHPDDQFANTHENDNGKTECWYILEAEEGASLICGLKSGLDKDQLANILADNQIEDYLESVQVKAGDMIYIPAGTVHAIQGGIKLLEVQQSSDVTYRIYDWGRDREIHIEKGLQVIDYAGVHSGGKIENFTKLETPYFNVEKVVINGTYENQVLDGFQTITVTKGTGTISKGNQKIELNPEDTVYLAKGTVYSVEGDLEFIRTY